MGSIFQNEDFALFECRKGDLLCEFILNQGFDIGVINSGSYHFHSSFEILIPVKGELHVLVDDRDLFVKPGDVCVIAPGAVHYIFGSPESFRISYRFNFSEICGSGAYFPIFESAYHSIKDVYVAKDCLIYEKYVSVAVKNLLESMPSFLFADLLFLANCDIAFKIKEPNPIARPQERGKSGSGSLLAEIIEAFFNENYTRPVTIDELARTLSFTRRHTERIMQKLFSMSFCELLHKKRLETAKLLLKTTQDSVSSIAERVGYQDKHYFYRRFTSEFKIAPAKYRNSFQKS